MYQQAKFHPHTAIYGWIITTSGLEKQTSAILEFYFRFHFQPLHHNRRVIVHQTDEFRTNSRRQYDVISILQHGGRRRSLLLPVFVFVYVSAFRRSKFISKPSLVDISPFTAKILLFSVWKNKRPPYWNFTSGFDLDHFADAVISV